MEKEVVEVDEVVPVEEDVFGSRRSCGYRVGGFGG